MTRPSSGTAIWTSGSANWSAATWDNGSSSITSTTNVGLDSSPTGTTQNVTVDTTATVANLFFGGSGNWNVTRSGSNSINITGNSASGLSQGLYYNGQGQTTIADNVIGTVPGLVMYAGTLSIGQFGSSSTVITLFGGNLILTGTQLSTSAINWAAVGINSGENNYNSNPILTVNGLLPAYSTNTLYDYGTVNGTGTIDRSINVYGVLSGNVNIGDASNTDSINVYPNGAITGVHNITNFVTSNTVTYSNERTFAFSGNVGTASTGSYFRPLQALVSPGGDGAPGVITVGTNLMGPTAAQANTWNVDLGVANANGGTYYKTYYSGGGGNAPTSDEIFVGMNTTPGTIAINYTTFNGNAIPGFASAASSKYYLIAYNNNNGAVITPTSATLTMPSATTVSGVTLSMGSLTYDVGGVSVTVTRSGNGTFTWQGNGANANWWTQANWNGGAITPFTGDTAAFSLSGTPITVDASTTAGAVTGLPAPAVSAITLGGSGVLNINGSASSNPLAVTNSIAVGSGQTVQGNAYITATGGIAVTGSGSSHGVLGGNLHVNGSVTATSGGQLSPGASSGSGLTINNGSLTLDSTSLLNYYLNGVNSTANSTTVTDSTNSVVNLTGTGTLTLGGAQLTIARGSAFGAGEYTLFTYTGTSPGTLAFTPIPGYSLTLKTSTANYVYLDVATSASGPFSYTWTGAGSNQNWSTTSNWTSSNGGTTYPGATDTAVFGLGGTTTVNVDGTGSIESAATLTLNNTGTLSLIGSQALTVTNAVNVGSSAAQTFTGSGTLAVTGGLNINSQGTLASLAGNTVHVTGNVVSSGGTFSPGGSGSAGTVAISGSLTLDSNATLNFDLGSSSDQIIVGSLASNTANGKVYITPGAGFASAVSNSYPVVAYSSSGTSPTNNLAWGANMPPNSTAPGAGADLHLGSQHQRAFAVDLPQRGHVRLAGGIRRELRQLRQLERRAPTRSLGAGHGVLQPGEQPDGEPGCELCRLRRQLQQHQRHADAQRRLRILHLGRHYAGERSDARRKRHH